jgi:DNA (cytosine-5)-methyltransferase 1
MVEQPHLASKGNGIMVALAKNSQTTSTGAYTKKLPDPSLVYVIDFFSGCGGMSWGFANTRQSHIAYKILGGIDIDGYALKTYEANIGAPGIKADVKELAENPERLRSLMPDFDPSICRPLVFIGCPPCQGFSAHRKKDDRDDPRNVLMRAFATLCEYYKPDAFVMENVPEIIKGKYDNYFHEAADILKGAGYSLTMDVLDLSLYGVPQRRRRAVILGTLTGMIDLPAPIFTSEQAPTVRQAISHLAPIPAGGVDSFDPYHRAPQHTERILERIKKTPPDGGDRRDLSEDDQLECHTSVDKSSTPGFTDVYGRLRWDAPSVTITAKCSTPSCGRFLHPEQHRNISVREAAILQGFPKSYKFEGPLIQQYRQVGEAVPPLFSRFLAWQILDHICPQGERRIQILETFKSHPVESHIHNISIVDGFCGAGGIALGFKFAGYSTAYAFDIDADSVKTFSKNISPVVEQADIQNSDLAEKIERAVGENPFVLAGGPPCQGFSQQRRGNDDDERNNLVLRYADLVRNLKNKPLAVVLENVTYLTSPRGKRIFAEYIGELENQGYKVFRHDLNSAAFGVPQLRRRIIVVALQEAIADRYQGPCEITPDRWPTLGEVIKDLPERESQNLLGVSYANHTPTNEGDLNKRRIAYVDMGQGRTSIPQELQLECHTKYDGHLDVYGRLDWFSQARTITAGFDSFTRGEFAHPFFHRSITPREAARIQGFPDWFVFQGNRAAVRKQIGNAVPPPMAYAIATTIKDAIYSNSRILQWADF